MADTQPENTVVPMLIIDNAAEALDFYVNALGAKLIYNMPTTDGKKVMHASIEIGNTRIYISDVVPDKGTKTSGAAFCLYTHHVDAAFKKACEAGAKEKTAPKDMFWGDRMGSVEDKFGVQWTFARHVRDVTPDEIKEAMKKMEAA